MSPLKKSNNIAARMGRWSARHWKTAFFGWLAFVVAALFIGNVVGTKQIKDADTNVGQSQKADKILAQAGFADQNVQAEFVLVQSKTLTADSPAFRAVVNDGERSIPITIGVLLLVFGALFAAGIPLLLALSAVAATLGLVALPSHLIPMDQNVSAVLLLIGLAVGVDYSLFYLKREREERAAGRSAEAALEAAAATSGRSVLISGFTVMIAMAGMLLTGEKSYLSFGIGTMMVVGIAMLGP